MFLLDTNVAKPLMVALSIRMIDELGDGPGAGLRVRLYFWTRRLIASGQIQLQRIDGYQRLSEVLEHAEVAA